MLRLWWSLRPHSVGRWKSESLSVRHYSSQQPPRKSIRWFTEDEDKYILKRVKEGVDLTVIASELDRIPGSVRSRYVRQLCTERPATERCPFTKEQDEVIVQRKLQGVYIATIAQELNCRESTVQSRWCRVLQHRADVQSSPLLKKSKRTKRLLAGLNPTEVGELITNRMQEGRTITDIAAELNCSTSTVSQRYREVCPPHERSIGQYGRRFTSDELETIKQRSSDGATAITIANELGRPVNSVTRIMMGMRRRAGTMTRPKRFTPEEDERLLELRKQSTPYAEIGRILGRDKAVVLIRIRHLENPIPPRKRWTPAEVEEAIRQYDAGVSIAQLAKRLGRYYTSLTQKLQQEFFRRGRPPMVPSRSRSKPT